jgi:hypothetical protein
MIIDNTVPGYAVTRATPKTISQAETRQYREARPQLNVDRSHLYVKLKSHGIPTGK